MVKNIFYSKLINITANVWVGKEPEFKSFPGLKRGIKAEWVRPRSLAGLTGYYYTHRRSLPPKSLLLKKPPKSPQEAFKEPPTTNKFF